MDLTPYVEQLRRELLVSAEVGGEEARALAERLTAPLEASLRLALLSALSTAAEEITSQLAPGTVDVRLRGGDLGFVVTAPGPPHADGEDTAGDLDPAWTGPGAPPEPPAAPARPDPDDANTARITLRLPEGLKTRIEAAAGAEGTSVNTWLVRAITGALGSARPTGPADSGGPPDGRRRDRWSGQHYSGWVR